MSVYNWSVTLLKGFYVIKRSKILWPQTARRFLKLQPFPDFCLKNREEFEKRKGKFRGGGGIFFLPSLIRVLTNPSVQLNGMVSEIWNIIIYNVIVTTPWRHCDDTVMTLWQHRDDTVTTPWQHIGLQNILSQCRHGVVSVVMCVTVSSGCRHDYTHETY